MNCRGCGLFTLRQGSPVHTIPALKTITLNAALRIAIRFANWLDEGDNIEALLLLQIHL